MRICKIYLIFFFILSLLTCSIQAMDSLLSEEHFTKAQEQYINDDLDGAIASLEEAVKYDPDNINVKEFLGLCIYKAAYHYYEQKNYKKALPYLKNLSELMPEDHEIKKYVS